MRRGTWRIYDGEPVPTCACCKARFVEHRVGPDGVRLASPRCECYLGRVELCQDPSHAPRPGVKYCIEHCPACNPKPSTVDFDALLERIDEGTERDFFDVTP